MGSIASGLDTNKLGIFRGRGKMSENKNNCVIEFSDWNEEWERETPEATRERAEGVKDSASHPKIDKRSDKNSFDITDEDVKSHEANIKWEFGVLSNTLNEIRRRKFFAINASMILFPGLIGALAVITSAKVSSDNPGFYWVSMVSISMFIGLANMIAIKYIAAFKAQANLHLRQLNCLRQALDSIAYLRFEKKYPVHLKSLKEGGVYYKTFGKHRKLPVGNEGFRNRFMGAFSESADKSLIGFLFFTSSILLSAPYIYLISVSLTNWSKFVDFHYLSMIATVNVTLGCLILSVLLFVFIHRNSFAKLRNGDGVSKVPQVKDDSSRLLFEYNWWDVLPTLLILMPSIYWIVFSIVSTSSIYSWILVVFAVISLSMFFTCVRKVFFDSLNRIHKSMISKSSSIGLA